MVEGVGLVDEREVRGQLVRGDPEPQHFLVIEDVGVVGARDHGQGGQGHAVQELVRHFGHEPAFLESTVHLAADDAVAEHEAPGAVDGHIGIGPDGREHLVDGIDVLLRILVEGNQEDHGVRRQGMHRVEDFLQAQVVLILERQAADEGGLHGAQLVADGHARDRGVAEDDEAATIRMEAQGQFQGFADVGFLEHACVVGVAVEPLRMEIVDAAKDHGRVREKLVLVFAQEVEGEIVRSQDDFKAGIAVFELVEIVEHAAKDRIGELLRVHVLDLQVHVEIGMGKRIADAGQDFIRPLVAVLVRVEIKDVLADFFGHGRTRPEKGQEEKAGENPSGHGCSRQEVASGAGRTGCFGQCRHVRPGSQGQGAAHAKRRVSCPLPQRAAGFIKKYNHYYYNVNKR